MRAEIRSLPPPSPTVCRGSGCSFLWSLLWHGLAVAILLQLGRCVTREPPHLLVNEVQFVQERTPEPPSMVQPAPLSPPAVQPPPPPAVQQPMAKPAALPARPAATPRRLSVAAATSPAIEAATTISADTGETARPAVQSPAPVAIAATAPGYHLGAVETPAPVYPFAARKRRRQGVVLVQLDVGVDGRVDRVVLLESSGDSALDEAAMATLGRWRLRPASENNRPVPGRVEVPVRFRLE